MIQVFQPSFGADELASVARVFHSNWVGKGPKVTEFEAAWATHINASPANVVSVNSCTEGLFTAVQLLGIGPGDEVIIPTIHFVGTAQAVLSAGAMPVFCDVDSRTLNVRVEDIFYKISKSTKAIILNHYGGIPSHIEEMKLFLDNGYYTKHIKIIEDAACAPASTYNGQAVGTFGDIGCWSFDSMKVISTGDGGMLYIRDEALADKARKMLHLGTSTDSGLSSDKARWWEFEVEIEGARRSVMNDVAAAIGLEQLRKLKHFVVRRGEITLWYRSHLADLPIELCPTGDDLPGLLSHYFFWIQTPQRDELAHYLREQGIYTTFRYYPLHWAYDTDDDFPNAETAAHRTLLLPLHQGLSDDQVSYICEKVREFFGTH